MITLLQLSTMSSNQHLTQPFYVFGSFKHPEMGSKKLYQMTPDLEKTEVVNLHKFYRNCKFVISFETHIQEKEKRLKSNVTEKWNQIL